MLFFILSKILAQIEIKPSISTASLSFDSTLDQQISSEDVTQDLSKYFLGLVEKKKAEGSRSAELHSPVNSIVHMLCQDRHAP